MYTISIVIMCIIVIIIVIILYALNYIVRKSNRKHFVDATIYLQTSKTVYKLISFPKTNFCKPREQHNSCYISNTYYIVNTYYIANTYYATTTYY